MCEAGVRCRGLWRSSIQNVLLCKLAEVHKPRGPVANTCVTCLPCQLSAPDLWGTCSHPYIEVATCELLMRCWRSCEDAGDTFPGCLLWHAPFSQTINRWHVHIVHNCLLAIRKLDVRKLCILISLSRQHRQGFAHQHCNAAPGTSCTALF